jgi:hypothetical protein
MKNYGALRIIAFILKLIGWLTIVFAIGVFVVGLIGPNVTGSAHYTAGVVGAALATAISGILVLASGEAISALVDIAMNSAKIEHHSARTVELFERMDASRRAQ